MRVVMIPVSRVVQCKLNWLPGVFIWRVFNLVDPALCVARDVWFDDIVGPNIRMQRDDDALGMARAD